MNKEEARRIALRIEDDILHRSYDQIAALIDDAERFEVGGDDGVIYQVVVDAHREPALHGDPPGIRVFIAVDDGGWSSFSPVSRHVFVEEPNGA